MKLDAKIYIFLSMKFALIQFRQQQYFTLFYNIFIRLGIEEHFVMNSLNCRFIILVQQLLYRIVSVPI